MPELVFYDKHHPLKRKWNATQDAVKPEQQSHPPQRPLPRLPSLVDWANLKLQNHIVCPVELPTMKTEELPTPAATEETPTRASTPCKPAAPMRNTSRERMKAEQASLRAQAVCLENELACIQQIQHKRLTSHNPSAVKSSFGWQEMAQQQWEHRVEAERENKRLRTTVGSLMSEVKGLESLFKSRSSALMASLRQSSQLALQVQALMADERLAAVHDKATESSQELHHSSSSSSERKLSSSSTSSSQQSPRDVACASMEPWSSQSSSSSS